MFRANQVDFSGAFQEGQNIGTGRVPIKALEFVREHSLPVTRRSSGPVQPVWDRAELRRIRFGSGQVVSDRYHTRS